MFEKKDGHVIIGIKGNIREVTNDVIYLLGAVHDAVKQRDECAAMIFRLCVEMFCMHGTKSNEALFEHFDDRE